MRHPNLQLAVAVVLGLCASSALAQPKGGGTVDQFYGAFATEVPVEAPKFRSLTPNIKLAYSSSGGVGWIGVGWSISGASFIQRAGVGKGTPKWDASDIFLLDGMELVPCTTLGGTHCTRIQSYQRITWDAANNRWYAWTRDGTKATYVANFTTSRGTYRWALSSVQDTRGNVVNYAYWCDGASECYLDNITYNGTVVKFYSELRSDTETYATGAGYATLRYRLKTIDICVRSPSAPSACNNAGAVDAGRARAYKLNYATSGASQRSVLTSVQQYGRDALVSAGTVTGGTALPAMTMGQSAGSPAMNLWWGNPNLGQGATATKWLTVDANGDGRSDLLQIWNNAGRTAGILYSSSACGMGQTWASGDMGSGIGALEWLTGDVNGDGKTDVIQVWNNGGYASFIVYGATGSGYALSWSGTMAQGSGGKWLAGDINGDGKTDLIQAYPGPTGIAFNVYLSNGTGFTYAWGSTAFTTTADATNWFVGDVNGDGRSDVIQIASIPSCYDSCSGTYTCTTTGISVYTSNGAGLVNTYNSGDLGFVDSSLAWFVGDVNGDGKSDLIRTYQNGSSLAATVWTSDGASYVQAWSNTALAGIAGIQTLLAGDVNGDGRIDLVMPYVSGASSHFGVQVFTARAGNGFAYAWGSADVGQGRYNIQSWGGGDFDGDGKFDFITPWSNGGTLGLAVIRGSGAPADLVTSVGNGLGGSTTIDYSPSSAWVNTYLPAGLVFQTVRATTNSDGRGAASTATYNFQGGLWSDVEKRFLGFRKVTAVLDAAGNYTETYYHQHVGCISKPEATYYKDPAGNLFSYTTYEYTENTSPPYTSLLTTRWDYECNQSASCRRSLTQLAYDQYANVTAQYEYGDYDLSGDERTAYRGYYPNTTAYIVGMPAYENIYVGIGTGGALAKSTLWQYDANATYAAAPTVGNITKKRGWLNTTGGYSETTFEYDAWGNMTAETDAVGSRTTTSFDPTWHVYPVGRCDALGRCSSQVWDTVMGFVNSSTEPNGYTTTFTHDAVGRPVRETRADGNYIEFSYVSWGSPTAQKMRETLSDGTADGQWKEVYYDGLGRIYKTIKEGPSTKETVYSDASNRVWKESQWYGTGETPRYTVNAYDGAGRLRTMTAADGSYAENVFGNGTITNYDELRHEKTIWKDAYGRTSQVREKNNGASQVTTYAYDVLGRIVRSVDANGNQATFTWDSLGRKTYSCDPSGGCWSYGYDAAGRLVSQTDAKGQTLTFTYDALGRMKTKTYPNGEQVVWSYDEAGHGAAIGQVTSVSYSAGSESYTYDFAGRVTAATRCVRGICYTMKFAYDRVGRLQTVTYPDGEAVPYGYDATGHLASVGGYVTSLGYDARGHITGASFANGTTTTFSYDPNRAWLTNAVVTGPGGTVYQASYSYDAAARITAQSSTTNPLSNLTYTYDDLNRLLSVSGGQSQTFSYDAIGNMTYNSALGSYGYGDSRHKHAVTAAGSRTYAYDANGNMTSAPNRALAWNYDNRPASITTGNGTVDLEYDADGRRVRKGTTYYFGQYLELSGGQLVKYYFAGGALVAKQDATGKYWYHQDHLGSVRAMTNGSGLLVKSYDFAPYGARVGQSGSVANPRGFTGHVTDDETGLVYMNARYYDPELGRFVSADPLVPDPENPQALNRYAYAYNNPISNIDPSGHAPIVIAVISLAGVLMSTAPAWVVAIAVVGAACTIAGYILENPLLSTIGGILMGFAGGFAGGAGFLAGPGWAGGLIGAAVAAVTSPLSPLDPGLKQVIGWAYTANCLIKGLYDAYKARGAGGGGEKPTFKSADEAMEYAKQQVIKAGYDPATVKFEMDMNVYKLLPGEPHVEWSVRIVGEDGVLLRLNGGRLGAGAFTSEMTDDLIKTAYTKTVDLAGLNKAIQATYAGGSWGYNWTCQQIAERVGRAIGVTNTYQYYFQLGTTIARFGQTGTFGFWSQLTAYVKSPVLYVGFGLVGDVVNPSGASPAPGYAP